MCCRMNRPHEETPLSRDEERQLAPIVSDHCYHESAFVMGICAVLFPFADLCLAACPLSFNARVHLRLVANSSSLYDHSPYSWSL